MIGPLLISSGVECSVGTLMTGGYPWQIGSALGNPVVEQFLVASTNSNVPNPISNKAYSLLGIIKSSPTHMSGTRR